MSNDDLKFIELKSLTFAKPNGGHKNSNNPTVFFSLGNVQQRNVCFKYAKNLPKGISIDKHVPKNYLSKYKELKSTAWKLRVSKGFQTRIDFEGPVLTLRYKQKDTESVKYSWTIYEEYIPKPELPQQKSVYTPAEGATPTPVIPPASMCNVGVMTNILQGEPNSDLNVELRNHFFSTEEKNVSSIDFPKPGVAIVNFVSSEKATEIISKLNGKVFNGKKVNLSKF